MASRRTRIKGIAHIPQRRKTGNEANSEESLNAEPEIDRNRAEEKHNPNLDTSHAAEAAREEESVNVEPPAVTEPENLPTPTVVEKETQDTEDVASFNDSKTEEPDTKTKPNPSRIIRRKFMKPTVSVNAISNRKAREADDVKLNAPKPPKQGRIVILNEVIRSPNEVEEVIIQNPPKEDRKDYDSVDDVFHSPQRPQIKPQALSAEREQKRLTSFHLLPTVSDNNEYPVPPPSPSKINRSRIKAVPRLGQRHTSFSASESEDESRRNYRVRNDSVCSATSGLQDTNSMSECLSPQKPKEFNSVIQRKCRRTEQSRKLAEARRDFYLKFGNNTPDRQKLTMIDLIFYNPTTNPMNQDNKQKRDATDEEVPAVEENNATESVKSVSDDENDSVPAPQIKIGPQGEIVVDEQSLVIESKSIKKSREEIQNSKVIDGDLDKSYGVYKRAKRSKDWSKHETLKFYKALNTIGTDFTLMCEFFPKRSRRELKMKFKKEERINKPLIDRAIMQPSGFDFHDFKHAVDMEEKEQQELQKQKEREQLMKKEMSKKRKSTNVQSDVAAPKVAKVVEEKRPKKKPPLDIMKVLDDDESDADVSELGSDDEDFDDPANGVLQTIQRPTRSGRMPKILDRYKPPTPKNSMEKSKPVVNSEPGSLMVVASTGPNGEPVYKVYMVTDDQNRQQIGGDIDSLSKAIEFKTRTNLKSLFTLTTSNIQDTGETVEENNFTIPAGEDITIPAGENITIPAVENFPMECNDAIATE